MANTNKPIVSPGLHGHGSHCRDHRTRDFFLSRKTEKFSSSLWSPVVPHTGMKVVAGDALSFSKGPDTFLSEELS